MYLDEQTIEILLNIGIAILVLFGVFLSLFIYFLPTYIASKKRHKNRRAIFWVNLLFGSSGVGWIVSLIWAYCD